MCLWNQINKYDTACRYDQTGTQESYQAVLTLYFRLKIKTNTHSYTCEIKLNAAG